MFNSALNNQQLWTPFFDNNGNPLCFNWQQSDNATSKFFYFQYLYSPFIYRFPALVFIQFTSFSSEQR